MKELFRCQRVGSVETHGLKNSGISAFIGVQLDILKAGSIVLKGIGHDGGRDGENKELRMESSAERRENGKKKRGTRGKQADVAEFRLTHACSCGSKGTG
jgi:hypothetical protein